MHYFVRPFITATLLAFSVWVVLLGGTHPQFWGQSDPERIAINAYMAEEIACPNNKYLRPTGCSGYECRYSERILTTHKEIATFQEVFGTTWDGIFPLNSLDTDFPQYRVTIESSNTQHQVLRFTPEEWGNSGSTPQRVRIYMRNILSSDNC